MIPIPIQTVKDHAVIRGFHPANRWLFGIGSGLFCLGYFILYWSLKTLKQNSAFYKWGPDAALGVLLLSLLMFVVLPFFSRRSLLVKIVFSVGLIAAWSVIGNISASLINHALGLPHLTP